MLHLGSLGTKLQTYYYFTLVVVLLFIGTLSEVLRNRIYRYIKINKEIYMLDLSTSFWTSKRVYSTIIYAIIKILGLAFGTDVDQAVADSLVTNIGVFITQFGILFDAAYASYITATKYVDKKKDEVGKPHITFTNVFGMIKELLKIFGLFKGDK